MQNVLSIHPTDALQGEMTLPGSKSHTLRAIMLALLARGESRIQNFVDCQDTQDALALTQQCGLQWQLDSHTGLTTTHPGKLTMPARLYSGSSGLATRLLIPMLGLQENLNTQLQCSAQMRKRPIQPLLTACRQLGMEINNAWPLSLRGRLQGGRVTISGRSSQYLTALLLSLSCVDAPSEITVTDCFSQPYIDITCYWLDVYNIAYQRDKLCGCEIFYLPGAQQYHGQEVVIPGDFSSAAFFIVAGCLLPGKIILQGLDPKDAQGDKALISLLILQGANITWSGTTCVIQGPAKLQGGVIDVKAIPDCLPILTVLGTQMTGGLTLVNAGNTRDKETDRIASMTDNLQRMGAKIRIQGDSLIIAPSQLHGARLESFNDHRTAMSLAIAALVASSPTQIHGAKAITKTYPNFTTHLSQMGASVDFTN